MIATCSFDRTAKVWEEIAGEKSGNLWIRDEQIVVDLELELELEINALNTPINALDTPINALNTPIYAWNTPK